MNFSETRLASERMPAWPSPAVGGARLITVKLPVKPLLGGSEPLLVTGQTKAAEIVFVKYPDAEHGQIGYDKWGIGGQVSGPIPVRAGQAREIEVSLGSLYGAGVFPLETAEAEVMRRLRETVLVLLDGRVVLKQASESFPAGNEQIRGGVNAVGGLDVRGEILGGNFTGGVLGGGKVAVKPVRFPAG